MDPGAKAASRRVELSREPGAKGTASSEGSSNFFTEGMCSSAAASVLQSLN